MSLMLSSGKKIPLTDTRISKMKMTEVREKAKKLGIKAKNPKKSELIKMIQRAEGNPDCFGTADLYCDQEKCCFRDDCMTLND